MRFGSDKANLYAYTRTMAHEEALVLTKEWDPRTFFPIFFILSFHVELSKATGEGE